MSRALADLTWEQAGRARDHVVLIPVGSTEAHGPHLPLGTDVIIATELAQRSAEALEANGRKVLIAPAIAYTVTEYATGFAGTVSLTVDAARVLIEGVCAGFLREGFKKLVLVNGHLEPNHIRILRDTAKSLDVCFPDNTRRRWVPSFSDEFQGGDCHAGRYETSLVLAARFELVGDFSALAPVEVGLVDKMADGVSTFTEAGAADAYMGDPAAATVEHGNQQYDRLVEMVVTEVNEKY